MFRRHQTLYVRNHRQGGGPRHLAPVVMLMTVVGACLGILVGKVYLEHQTFKLGIQWERVDRELNQVLSEQDNLIVERERHTQGPYVLPKAREMGLVPAMAGQVRLMRQPTVEEGDRQAMLATNRE